MSAGEKKNLKREKKKKNKERKKGKRKKKTTISYSLICLKYKTPETIRCLFYEKGPAFIFKRSKNNTIEIIIFIFYEIRSVVFFKWYKTKPSKYEK